jgi:hypothetical protein
MPYMAQQWVTDAARAAFRGRADALEAADRAREFRTWLASLPLDAPAVAALVEPIAALEDGIRAAGRGAGPAPDGVPDRADP